jgi:AcrR family transcriptional regulator
MDRFEQRRLTRQKLIDAALELFSTSGYEHATIDDVSAAAGYSKGAYYFHFSTKEDILLELLRIWTEERASVLAAHTGEAGDAGALREMLAAFFSYDAAPRWPAVLLEFWAQAGRSQGTQEVHKRLSQAYAGWRTQLASAFAVSGAVGAAGSDDAAALALAAHDGLAVQTAIGAPGGKAMTAKALAEALVASLEAASEPAERRAAVL